MLFAITLLTALLAAPAPDGSPPTAAPESPALHTDHPAPPDTSILPQSNPSYSLDPVAATNAYLASLPPEQRARSDRYFDGNCWLNVWQFLLLASICLALLFTGCSAAMRAIAQRLTRFKSAAVLLYWLQFSILMFVLFSPLTFYTSFIREHQYGLSTQALAPWLADTLKEFAVHLTVGGLFLLVLYIALRRSPRAWWAWATAATVILLVAARLIFPIAVYPLFGTYRTLADSPVKSRILGLARANGIPAEDIYVVDASRQSTRVSAHVTGLLGTQRIALNDNLLNRCSLPEIEAIMGHEMGHYVLNHQYMDLLFYGILIAFGFLLVHHLGRWALTHWGPRWRIQALSDVAALPLLTLVVATYMFLCTPLTNSYVRAREYQADIFGLNAAGQPDGEAAAALKLAEYRKLDPGPVEEFIWFDHPSGRARIFTAMRWKAEHLRLRQQEFAQTPALPAATDTPVASANNTP